METSADTPVDFIQQEGLPFLAHLLRRLSDRLVEGFTEWYPTQGIAAPVRTASTMRLLYRKGPMPVTVIAQEICQSHPLVITWVRQLTQLGLVEAHRDPADARKSIIALTDSGRATAVRMVEVDRAIIAAYQGLFAEAQTDCFSDLWRLEAACRNRGMASRLQEASSGLADEEGRSPHAVDRAASNSAATL